MSTKREAAKFFAGFETFHALFHGYLTLTQTPFGVFGWVIPLWLSLIGFVVNAAIALLLGAYAWRTGGQQMSDAGRLWHG